MNGSLQHRTAAMLGFAMIALFLFAAPARAANISCSPVSMSALAFGTVNPAASQTTASATLGYSCNNISNQTFSATLCFSIGEPGGGPTNPRLMSDGAGHTLQFQLYQDAAHSIVWGSSVLGANTPLQVNITIGGKSTASGSATLYGQVLGNQTSAIPGSYTDSYTAADTALTINETNGSTAPGSCAGGGSAAYFPFLVSATVVKQCTVSANPLDFGSANLLTANADATTTLQVQCTNSTPYQIGLDNGQNASGTTRRMAGGSSEFVTYELYSDANRSQRWGNAQNSDTAIGTGNGASQNTTVYGRIAPQSTPSPSTYTDTVTVNVFY